MNETEREVLPYLRHMMVARRGKCSCPPDSWAPCGGQYEGRYDSACPEHRRAGGAAAHAPSGCPNQPLEGS